MVWISRVLFKRDSFKSHTLVAGYYRVNNNCLGGRGRTRYSTKVKEPREKDE